MPRTCWIQNKSQIGVTRVSARTRCRPVVAYMHIYTRSLHACLIALHTFQCANLHMHPCAHCLHAHTLQWRAAVGGLREKQFRAYQWADWPAAERQQQGSAAVPGVATQEPNGETVRKWCSENFATRTVLWNSRFLGTCTNLKLAPNLAAAVRGSATVGRHCQQLWPNHHVVDRGEDAVAA